MRYKIYTTHQYEEVGLFGGYQCFTTRRGMVEFMGSRLGSTFRATEILSKFPDWYTSISSTIDVGTYNFRILREDHPMFNTHTILIFIKPMIHTKELEDNIIKAFIKAA